jgi:PRTRC genetic system protein A
MASTPGLPAPAARLARPAMPVDYLVARGGAPPPSGLAYDYVLAGDGLFVHARSRLLHVRARVAPCMVRGLPPLYTACILPQGRLPLAIWDAIVDAVLDARASEREVLLAVVHRPTSGYELVRPLQVGGATRVLYQRQPDTILELHSHGRLPARFSATDDLDEQRLSLFGVVGRLDRPRPEVRLRAGAYGYFLPLPWDSVFDGAAGDLAPFRDATTEPPDPLGPPPPSPETCPWAGWPHEDGDDALPD